MHQAQTVVLAYLVNVDLTDASAQVMQGTEQQMETAALIWMWNGDGQCVIIFRQG